MSQASPARPRRVDGIATMVLLILAALIQLFSGFADSNMKRFGTEFGSISKFDLHMLTALNWGGWVLLILGSSIVANLRRYRRIGWPWALLLAAALFAIALWSTDFSGS